MNILLVNNHSIENIGDYAILRETLRLLATAFPGAHIVLSFNDVDSARHALATYEIVGSPITWLTNVDQGGDYRATSLLTLLRTGLGALAAALVYRLMGHMPRVFKDQERQALLQALGNAELVLGCGGGYLYSVDAHEGRTFVMRVLSCLLAVIMAKPLILLPQSIGPLHHPFQRQIVRFIIAHSLLTLVREQRSLQLLTELGCAERALPLPDMAFGLPSAPEVRAHVLLAKYLPVAMTRDFRVGVTALDWGRQNRGFEGQARYERALVGGIDHITSSGGIVILFAQCYGPGALEDDRRVNERLHAAVHQPERVIVVDELLAPELLQAAYGCMDFLIGTRMHSVILAINAGVPVLAIGYLHKTQGLFEAIGMSTDCLDIGTVTAERIIKNLERLRQGPAQAQFADYRAHAQRMKQVLPMLLRIVVG